MMNNIYKAYLYGVDEFFSLLKAKIDFTISHFVPSYLYEEFNIVYKNLKKTLSPSSEGEVMVYSKSSLSGNSKYSLIIEVCEV